MFGAYEVAARIAKYALAICYEKDAETLLLAGEANLGLGKWDEAINYYSKSLKIAPNGVMAREGRCEAMMRLLQEDMFASTEIAKSKAVGTEQNHLDEVEKLGQDGQTT